MSTVWGGGKSLSCCRRTFFHLGFLHKRMDWKRSEYVLHPHWLEAFRSQAQMLACPICCCLGFLTSACLLVGSWKTALHCWACCGRHTCAWLTDVPVSAASTLLTWHVCSLKESNQISWKDFLWKLLGKCLRTSFFPVKKSSVSLDLTWLELHFTHLLDLLVLVKSSVILCTQ